jgi:hypothetical protein
MRAFCGKAALPEGEWDEFSAWLNLPVSQGERKTTPLMNNQLVSQLRQGGSCLIRAEQTWALLRAARYQHRPGQADQLHVDIWRRGQNLTLDAGTYRYNAAAPWENALGSALVHNSVTVDGQEPMYRAGRFLWLDWDQAEVLEQGPTHATAQRSGYLPLGVRHRRRVEYLAGEEWMITDDLTAVEGGERSYRLTLHWLFPDWPWRFVERVLQLDSPVGLVRVAVQCQAGSRQVQPGLQLVRAGEGVYGSGDAPAVLGWVSPTYGSKNPALSLRVEINSSLPVKFITRICP